MDAIKATVAAQSKDANYKPLYGIGLHVAGDTSTIVATDGKRIHMLANAYLPGAPLSDGRYFQPVGGAWKAARDNYMRTYETVIPSHHSCVVVDAKVWRKYLQGEIAAVKAAAARTYKCIDGLEYIEGHAVAGAVEVCEGSWIVKERSKWLRIDRQDDGSHDVRSYATKSEAIHRDTPKIHYTTISRTDGGVWNLGCCGVCLSDRSTDDAGRLEVTVNSQYLVDALAGCGVEAMLYVGDAVEAIKLESGNFSAVIMPARL